MMNSDNRAKTTTVDEGAGRGMMVTGKKTQKVKKVRGKWYFGWKKIKVRDKPPTFYL
jgi:hypothetical protein